jgi:hypothetical protein
MMAFREQSIVFLVTDFDEKSFSTIKAFVINLHANCTDYPPNGSGQRTGAAGLQYSKLPSAPGSLRRDG